MVCEISFETKQQFACVCKLAVCNHDSFEQKAELTQHACITVDH